MEPSASQAPFVSATQQRWPNACPLVLTLIGDDRPDLVQSVSRVVATHGGSWQESQMARLAGKFAGILGVVRLLHSLTTRVSQPCVGL
jgi:glycine cleavage system regulatory protein